MLNNGYRYTNVVQNHESGLQILDFYSTKYSRFSLDEWNRRLKNNQISLNGSVIRDNIVISHKDVLEYFREPWEEPDVPDDMKVLYEEDDFVVLDKPAGFQVLPGDIFLENTLLNKGRGIYGSQFTPMHRLDRGTSGLIICAKTINGRKYIGKLMNTRSIQKIYLAVVDGNVNENEFFIESHIDSVPSEKMGTLFTQVENGKLSILKCKVLNYCGNSKRTLLQVELKTGRSHQVRIQLAYDGYPIAGDEFYRNMVYSNNSPEFGFPGDTGFCLHSWKLAFPVKCGKVVELTAEMPVCFKHVLSGEKDGC